MDGKTPHSYDTYPLNLVRGDIDAVDLTHYQSQLVRRAPSLFVSDSSSCKVEIREHINVGMSQSTDVAAAITSDEKCGQSNWSVISTLEDLQTILSVMP